MKYQKLVNELNNILDSATREQQKHLRKVEAYLEQFKAEERALEKRMRKESDEVGRAKLEKKLNTVREAYAILGY